MEKQVSFKELKIVAASFNEILDTGKIKIVGSSGEDIATNFKTKVEEFVKNGKVKELPDNVIDFFNTHFADDDDKPTKKGKKSIKGTVKSAPAKGAPAKGAPAKVVVKSAPAKGAVKAPAKGAVKAPAKVVVKSAVKAEKGPKAVRDISNVREYSVAQAMKKGGTADEIFQNADDIYVEKGGTSNLNQSTRLSLKCIKFCESLGILIKTGDKLSLKV